MDIFERLGDILDSLVSGESSDLDFSDPDIKQAWDELDTYINEESASGADSQRNRDHTSSRRQEAAEQLLARREAVKKAFAVLEVPYGASPERVKQSYRRLLVKYHPDRHAGDDEKMALATELTQQIADAYRRIESYYHQGS